MKIFKSVLPLNLVLQKARASFRGLFFDRIRNHLHVLGKANVLEQAQLVVLDSKRKIP
jgi:hypothetical protein